MQPGGIHQGKRLAKGMCQRLGQAERLVHLLQRLVGVAQHPQREAQVEPAHQPGVLAVADEHGVGLLRGRQHQAMLQVQAGVGEFPQPEQRGAQGTLGQRQQVFAQLSGLLERCLDQVAIPQAPQRGKLLHRIPPS
jgi:hypothetical protein